MNWSIGVTPYESKMRQARISFPRLLRAEWQALSSVRYTWITLVLGGGLALLTSVSAAFIWAPLADGPPLADALTQGTFFAQLAALMVGSSLFAREYSSGSLRTQFAAVPKRTSLMFAKATVLLATMFAFGLVLVFATLAASALIYSLAGREQGQDVGTILRVALGGSTLLALTGILGLGIAMIVRSEPVTIAIVLLLLLVIPVLLTLAGPGTWLDVLSDLMFASAGRVLTTPAETWGLGSFRDLLVTVAWPAGALGAGLLAVTRRDA